MISNCILPLSANSKLKEAEKRRQLVYISGMCGYGKTTFVCNYLKDSSFFYFDMLTDPLALTTFDTKKKATVVIDNLGFLTDSTVNAKILELISNPLCWCIIISRARCPEWLLTPSHSLGGFMLISEADLAFSYDEACTYLDNYGIFDLDDNDLSKLFKYSLGHPLFISFIASRLKFAADNSSGHVSFTNAIAEEARQLLCEYFDHALLDVWDDNLIKFAVMMSIVPSFSIPLAVEITTISNIESLIEEANRIGSFLTYGDGVYSIVTPLRRYLNGKMYSLYSKEKIVDIYNTAGHYFKRHNQILEAFDMYKKSDNKSGQLDILIENARLNPSDGYLTELKSAYLSLDEDTITQYPELIAALCMIYSLMLDVEQSEYWYNVLKEQATNLTGRSQKTAKRYLTYLDIACIHKPGKNVLSILKNLTNMVIDRSVIVPEWALTCNAPTIMNGGRDFCEWSKRDTEIYSALEIPFRRIFGKSSAGMPDLSLAESFLEKGESDYEIMRLVSKGQMDADMRGRIELVFVAVGILSQLHLIHGHVDDAKNVLLKFKSNNLTANPKLLANIDVMMCRISLLTGDIDAVYDWLSAAPDESTDFNVLYRYIYMCKIRCYLATDNTTDAYTLINKMLYYADICERTFIKMECLILLSILEYRSDMNTWDDTLSKALALAEEHHFIRVVSRESAAIYEMLRKCSYQYKNPDYKKQLFDEVDMVTQLYPLYLAGSVSDVTDIDGNALEILKLQADGMSNDEIANTLFISKNTVKYHCKENYRKLGVSNRLAAITEAKKRGII